MSYNNLVFAGRGATGSVANARAAPHKKKHKQANKPQKEQHDSYAHTDTAARRPTGDVSRRHHSHSRCSRQITKQQETGFVSA